MKVILRELQCDLYIMNRILRSYIQRCKMQSISKSNYRKVSIIEKFSQATKKKWTVSIPMQNCKKFPDFSIRKASKILVTLFGVYLSTHMFYLHMSFKYYSVHYLPIYNPNSLFMFRALSCQTDRVHNYIGYSDNSIK